MGLRNDCANYMGISLISISSKLILFVILRWLYNKGEELTLEEQARFLTGCVCISRVFTNFQVLGPCLAFRSSAKVEFMGIRTPFDPVQSSALWHCLVKDEVPEKCPSIFEELHCHCSVRVGAYGQLLPPFVVSSAI